MVAVDTDILCSGNAYIVFRMGDRMASRLYEVSEYGEDGDLRSHESLSLRQHSYRVRATLTTRYVCRRGSSFRHFFGEGMFVYHWRVGSTTHTVSYTYTTTSPGVAIDC